MASAHGGHVVAPTASTEAGDVGRMDKELIKKGRKFLDIFWDIRSKNREIRLDAVQRLIASLGESNAGGEMDYTLRRLVDGLACKGGQSRPGFSLALSQVMQTFEEVGACKVLALIRDRLDVAQVKKKFAKDYALGNVFGVLAMAESGRLREDPETLLEVLQHLRSLARLHKHLLELVLKSICEIVEKLPDGTYATIANDLAPELCAALSSTDHLRLFLVCYEKLPGGPGLQELARMLGESKLICKANSPRLVEVLRKSAMNAPRSESLLPCCSGLLRVAIREEAFGLFWQEVVEVLFQNGSSPCLMLCLHMLAKALPLLGLPELQLVLASPIMKAYGQHRMGRKRDKPNSFDFPVEMDLAFSSLLASPEALTPCLVTALIGFSRLSSLGRPAVPPSWPPLRHLPSRALPGYLQWLEQTFVRPDMSSLIDYSDGQKRPKEDSPDSKYVSHLRCWVVERLVALVDTPSAQASDDLLERIARFVLFHAFFNAKQADESKPEMSSLPKPRLDQFTRKSATTAFYSLLYHLNSSRPVLSKITDLAEESMEEKLETNPVPRGQPGVRRDGDLWVLAIARYADSLLAASSSVDLARKLSKEEMEAWTRTLHAVEKLNKRTTKSHTTSEAMQSTTFQLLLISVSLQLFSAGEEDSLSALEDLHTCVTKALSNKDKRSKAPEDSDAPNWVCVVVEVLLSLVAKCSRLLRNVCLAVFARICPYLTLEALQPVLNVLDPDKASEEDPAVLVMEDAENAENDELESESEGEESEECDVEGENVNGDDDDNDEDEDDDDDDVDDDDDEVVDEQLKLNLMRVLKAGNALGGESSDEGEEEMNDEQMMAMDAPLSRVFAEHKRKREARRVEAKKARGVRRLEREFRIKVLDLLQVFVSRRASSPIIFSLMKPLLAVIRSGMRQDTDQQEQEYLRKVANVFMAICRSRRCPRQLGNGLAEELHNMLEKFVLWAGRQTDPSVGSYHFSGSLFLLRVLRGGSDELPEENWPSLGFKGIAEEEEENAGKEEKMQTDGLGCIIMDRVIATYRSALEHFLTRRNSSYSLSMFTNLVHRFPEISLHLPETLVSILEKSCNRPHHQANACQLILHVLQPRSVCCTLSATRLSSLLHSIIAALVKLFGDVSSLQLKAGRDAVVQATGLAAFSVRVAQKESIIVATDDLVQLLQALLQEVKPEVPRQVISNVCNVLRLLDIPCAANEKKTKKKKNKNRVTSDEPKISHRQQKRGFLPETKRRKKRDEDEEASNATTAKATTTREKTNAKGRPKNKEPLEEKKDTKLSKKNRKRQANSDEGVEIQERPVHPGCTKKKKKDKKKN
uniref:myb-binding protein 1A n=1 Tax=Myxine glutinosa TaxID=7769 RepID=UPI00359009A3